MYCRKTSDHVLESCPHCGANKIYDKETGFTLWLPSFETWLKYNE